MIGCSFLLKVSELLCEAKECTQTAMLYSNGCNIIFAGDFAQLPPVADTRLYADINTTRAGTHTGQNNIFGKLLWLDVTTVVILDEIMRQTHDDNMTFIHLLHRLREGRCTEADYQLLLSKTLINAQPDWSLSEWIHAPLIVSDNAVKDALNEKAALAFASHTNQEIHSYYAID
ncbi:hypothetical protein K474DRAFT_1573952, partial [Panus rudis PR-1116 ss-1]